MTFVEMQQFLARLLQDATSTGVPAEGTWSTDDLKQFINWANLHVITSLNNTIDLAITVEQTFNTVAGTRRYDLPADFLHMNRVWIANSHEIVFEHFNDKGIDTTNTGEPVRYWIEGGYRKTAGTEYFAQLCFEPIPSGVFAPLYDYYPSNLAMVADADISLIPSDYHGVILCKAARFAQLTLGMTQLRRDFDAEYKEGYALLESAMSKRYRRHRPSFWNAFGGGGGGLPPRPR